ncbi:glycosyltransferase family 4 protein [Streptomyces sanglieri]
MNILYYLGTFPKLSESFILNEIYELEQSGHNVAVCAKNEPNSKITHEEFDQLDIPIQYLDLPSVTDTTELLSTKILQPQVLKHARYRAPLKHHATYLFRAKRCIEFINDLGWDLNHVHSHFATRSKFTGRYVASHFGVPFTLTAHAAGLYKEPIGDHTTDLLQSADRIVTISEYNRQYIQEQFTNKTPIDIVRAGIRPEKFSPTESTVDNRILTIARFVEKKGHIYALEAVAEAVDDIPEIEYHIIGSGRLEEQLKRTVSDLGIKENVVFLSNVDDQKLLQELDEASCFLLPCVIAESGDRDGIPVALMEAMAMKTSPISTTVSGVPELIDHEVNGLLVEPRDSKKTAGAIVRLLQNDEKFSEYAKQARETIVRNFNISSEANELESVFKKARLSN